MVMAKERICWSGMLQDELLVMYLQTVWRGHSLGCRGVVVEV